MIEISPRLNIMGLRISKSRNTICARLDHRYQLDARRQRQDLPWTSVGKERRYVTTEYGFANSFQGFT